MESAEHVTPTAVDWLGRNAKQDKWLLHVKLGPAHALTAAPEAFGNPFKDDPLPAWLTEEILQEHRRRPAGTRRKRFAMWDNRTARSSPPSGRGAGHGDFRRMIDGYDLRRPVHGRPHRAHPRHAGQDGRAGGQPRSS